MKPDGLRALKPNWDGDGGLPISEAAIVAAGKVLESKGQLTPCSDGGVQIDWPNAELKFLPSGEQDFD
jgi:hypothetical protein